jgi:L-ascorbate metabolism protein UlaG (beta-lactamase superfamily)
MKIKWLGHSSFLLTAADGTTVLTDPYESNSFSGALKYAPYTEPVDIVTISHDHADHGYTKGLVGKPTIVKWTGAYNAKGINIKGVAVFHDTEKGRQRGNNIVFVITVDRLNICHCGDLGHILSAADIALIGPIDIQLIPVGGFYTIDANDATAVVKQLNPKIVIPMHFLTDKCSFPIKPVDEFLKGKTNYRMGTSSEIELAADSLPAKQEIVVLQHAL